MALYDSQLDAYLRDKVKNFQIIPSKGVEDLFTFDGHPRFNFTKGQKYAMCVNLENAHWTALMILPLQVFYYDPLEVIVREGSGSKRFSIPQNIVKFAAKYNLPLITNDDPDQYTGSMCGAYSALKITTMDHFIKNYNPKECLKVFRKPLGDVRKLYHYLLSI